MTDWMMKKAFEKMGQNSDEIKKATGFTSEELMLIFKKY